MAIVDKPRDRYESFRADSIPAGTVDAQNIGPVLPVGKTVRIVRLGGSDEGVGDGKASTVGLQFGKTGDWSTLWGFSVASGTVDLKLSILVVGDGAKRLRILRKNTSGSAKLITCWVAGFLVG